METLLLPASNHAVTEQSHILQVDGIVDAIVSDTGWAFTQICQYDAESCIPVPCVAGIDRIADATDQSDEFPKAVRRWAANWSIVNQAKAYCSLHEQASEAEVVTALKLPSIVLRRAIVIFDFLESCLRCAKPDHISPKEALVCLRWNNWLMLEQLANDSALQRKAFGRRASQITSTFEVLVLLSSLIQKFFENYRKAGVIQGVNVTVNYQRSCRHCELYREDCDGKDPCGGCEGRRICLQPTCETCMNAGSTCNGTTMTSYWTASCRQILEHNQAAALQLPAIRRSITSSTGTLPPFNSRQDATISPVQLPVGAKSIPSSKIQPPFNWNAASQISTIAKPMPSSAPKYLPWNHAASRLPETPKSMSSSGQPSLPRWILATQFPEKPKSSSSKICKKSSAKSCGECKRRRKKCGEYRGCLVMARQKVVSNLEQSMDDIPQGAQRLSANTMDAQNMNGISQQPCTSTFQNGGSVTDSLDPFSFMELSIPFEDYSYYAD